jgi:hypothetical protein
MVSLLASSVVDRGFIATLEASTQTITLPMNPRSTTLEVSTLTITPLMNPRSTTLEANMLPITPSLLASSVVDRRFIGGVMVCVLASGAVHRGFDPRQCKTKDYNIGVCCFSAKHAALRRNNKDWLARNRDNVCPNGATFLSADCCFSELALSKSNKASSSFHWNITCSSYDIAEKIVELA